MKKQCNKCKKWKTFSEFYKHPRGKYGLHSRCKECLKKYARKYRQTKVGRNYQKEYRCIHKSKAAKQDKNYKKTLKGHLRVCFQNMKQRCNVSKNPAYKNYGGRGIKVNFKNADEFIDYIINELQIDPRGLQIDRIDNNSNYEKGNIRFVTAKINANNRRNSNGR